MTSPLLLLLAACQSQYVIEDASDTAAVDEGSGDTAGDTEAEEDYAEYDGARLVVTSPASGDFLAWGEAHTFSAEVRAADGSLLEFDEITWASDVDGAWTPVGASLEDDSLDVGTHALTAEAQLPNGDRLAYTIGGVLVQSAYTGVYTGTLSVTATTDFDGTAYSAGCAGAITLVIDAYGEEVSGDAGCLLSLLGYELDTAYIFELENDEGELEGTAALDLGFYQLDIDAEGAVDEDGTLTLAFAENVYVADLDASVEASRVSRDISEYE